MNRLYLSLADGTVFEGLGVDEVAEAAGWLSFYTGVVGYQEVISDPANAGKIVLFTYPHIGNYGVNDEDAESASVKVSGVVCKQYMPYYSNFRATGSLSDYLAAANVPLGTSFDTRAVLLHLREQGEMPAALAREPLEPDEVSRRVASSQPADYRPENGPVACAQAYPRVKAAVVDLGASKTFYRHLSALGLDACGPEDKAELVVVSDAPHYAVESGDVAERVRATVAGRPVIGFGHGSAVVARVFGGDVRRMPFGGNGINVPVASEPGGRNEITAQNQNYEVVPDGETERLFTNLHDGSCEGFVIRSARAAGASFIPGDNWLGVLLKAVGVEQDA